MQESNWREVVRITRGKSLRNHWLRFFLAKEKIALDNPWAHTYHTRAFAKGLTSHARKIYVGNWANRGADSHDE